MNWSLVIHGGCGAMRPDKLPPDQDERARAGLEAALDAGEAILAGRGSALDAVEAAARVLEEDPAFNAGRGSVLSASGRVELDAAIMDGRDRRAGAVAGLTATHPANQSPNRVSENNARILRHYLRAIGSVAPPSSHDLTRTSPIQSAQSPTRRWSVHFAHFPA